MDLEKVLPEGAGVTPATSVPIVVEPLRDEPKGQKCGFCGCTMAQDGSIVARGRKAAEYLDLDLVLRERDETIRKLTDKISTIEADAHARIRDLETQLAAKKKGFFD